MMPTVTNTTPRVLAQAGAVTLRPMRDDLDDYARMAHWMTDERVLAFYGGRDRPRPLDVVMTKYRPRVCGESPVVACLSCTLMPPSVICNITGCATS